jgi:hypothetical protein
MKVKRISFINPFCRCMTSYTVSLSGVCRISWRFPYRQISSPLVIFHNRDFLIAIANKCISHRQIMTKYSAFGKSLCTYKRYWIRFSWIVVSRIWIKQLHTLPVLHFNRCLTTEYYETTAYFNGNFDNDNQIHVP